MTAPPTEIHAESRTGTTPGTLRETAPDAGLRELWPYLREHRGALVVVALLSLVTAGTSLAQPLLVSRVIGAVQAAEAVGGLAGLLVVVLLTGAVLGAVQSYLLQRTAEGVVLSTRTTLAGRLLRLPVTEYDQRRSGDLISRVGADTTLLRAVVTSGLVEIASSLVVVVGAAVAMALVDLVLLGVTLAAVAAAALLIALASRRLRALSRLTQVRVGVMTAAVERSLGAVRTIRASGATDAETDTVVTAARAARDTGVRTARLQALVAPAATIATQGSFLAVLGLGGARVASGSLSIGDLVAFVLYLFLLVLPLAQLAQSWTQLQTGLGALGRIEEVRALAEETGPDVTVTDARPAQAPALLLRDVSFTHADGTRVLHGVDLTVPVGSRTALVGPSGAGKSTVLGLVERFYDVDSGAVEVAGVDVRRWVRAELRAGLGYVEQDSPVLAGTLRENLTLAAHHAAPAATDDTALHTVLEQVNLAGLLARNPLGLDAPVGEEGVLLSGGERQRLAIARTLLTRPALLLLDEPTASLDARNEAALRTAIDAAAADGRTLLVVAHRLSTVIDSDQIVVLDEGRVVGTGTHTELLTTSPLYAELARSQLLA